MPGLEGFIKSFHDDQVIIEKVDRMTVEISRDLLPPGAREGDFIIQQDDSRFRIDPEITEQRRRALRLMTDCYLE
jgi:hypothetical protein